MCGRRSKGNFSSHVHWVKGNPMSNPYSAPESIESKADPNASHGKAPTQLARIIRWLALGCFAFIVVSFIFGHGVVGSFNKAGTALFWLFLAVLIARHPRSSGIWVGILMWLSALTQSYFLRCALSGLPVDQIQTVGDTSVMWTKFYISLLPFGIGGIACVSLFWLFPKSNNSLKGGR